MDFLDPKKRKSHQIRLYIGYGLMGILISFISVLLLFQAYGYSFNVRTGNITQNGLLFASTNPINASMYVNGELKGVTDQRLILKEGIYEVSMQSEGYHNWEKSFVLEGGEIKRFQYPFLFPAEIVSNDVALFAEKPSFATQSPDRRWLVIQRPGATTTFEIYDLNSEIINPVSFEIPATLLTDSADQQQLKLVEWADDNQYFVINRTFSGGAEDLLINVKEPTLSKNLSKLIPDSYTNLRLRDKRFDSYYLHNKDIKILQQFDLGDTSASTVLTNVVEYMSHGDDELLYVTDENNGDNLVTVSMIFDGDKYTIRQLPKSSRYLLNLASYEGKWYVVAGSTAEEKVYVYRDPIKFLQRDSKARIIPATTLRTKNASSVTFSKNARFIMAQSGSDIAIYDAEESVNNLYNTEIQPDEGADYSWMDGHRITTTSNGVVQVFDFDGTNKRSLGKSHASFPAFFNTGYSAVFTVAPSEAVSGRTALEQTELTVKVQQ